MCFVLATETLHCHLWALGPLWGYICFWDTCFSWGLVYLKDIYNSWALADAFMHRSGEKVKPEKKDEMIFVYFSVCSSVVLEPSSVLSVHISPFFSLVSVAPDCFCGSHQWILCWSMLLYLRLHLWPYSRAALQSQVHGSWVCPVCYCWVHPASQRWLQLCLEATGTLHLPLNRTRVFNTDY